MERTCAKCAKPLTSTNPRAKFCSSTCRARKSEAVSARVHILPVVTPADQPVEHGPVYGATLAELVDAERESTALGQAALALAQRIDLAVDTGSGLSSAVKTLGETLTAATRGARRQETALDRVRRQRDEKRGA